MAVRVEELSGGVADAIALGFIPWRLPHLPRSAFTGWAYSGVDPLLLGIAAARLGCSSPFWATAEEWQALGVRVVQPPDQGVLLSSGEAVLNWEGTDRAYAPAELRWQDPAPVFDAIIKGLGVRIEYVFSAECKYIGLEDKIRMPHRLMFEIGPGGLSGFYDALGHELFHASERWVHWDGSPDVNELRAEIGSGYLLGALGIKPLPRHLARHHDAHAPRWVRLLRQDTGLLPRVCQNVVSTLGLLFKLAGTFSVDFAPDAHAPADGQAWA